MQTEFAKNVKLLEKTRQFTREKKKQINERNETKKENELFLCPPWFCQVIGRATAYKRLLLAVKSEYDSTIRELQRREEEARAARLTVAASESRRKSLLTCERQAAHLRER